MAPKMFSSETKVRRALVVAALACIVIGLINPGVASAKDYTYKINPPPDMPLRGKVNWFAEVFAPGGVTTQGISIQSNPNDSTQVTVSVDNSVVGDVVLYANYSTPTGVLVAMKPFTVVSTRPAAAQTGIELKPSTAILIAGERAQLFFNNLFADGSSQPVYLSDSSSAQFSSSNPNVATVNSFGEISGVSPGLANITANYRGYTTQIVAKIMAVGLGDLHIGGSAPEAVGKVGSPFSYQIVATGNPTNFDADRLPNGLTINKTTGEVTGTPMQAGSFAVTIKAFNETERAFGIVGITINP